MTGTLREDLRTIVTICRSVFRSMRNCSDKFVVKIKNTRFILNNCFPVFPEYHALYDR